MQSRNCRSSSSYLDISELLLKDISPCFKPRLPKISENDFSDEDSSSMTPLQLYEMEQMQIPESENSFLDQFMHINYFPLQNYSLADGIITQPKHNPKSKKFTCPKQQKQNNLWHYLDEQLLRILNQDSLDQDHEIYENYSDNQVSYEGFEIQNQEIDAQNQESKLNCIDQEGKKQKTEQNDRYQGLPLLWFQQKPQKDLLQHLKSVANSTGIEQQSVTNEIYRAQIKQFMNGLLFDYEKNIVQSQIDKLDGSIKCNAQKLIQGIKQTMKRKIGVLSYHERRIKLVNYLAKKKSRVWRKKVNYDCRKRVADKRLRIQGKFVTVKQACQRLGENEAGCGIDKLKQLLSEKSMGLTE